MSHRHKFIFIKTEKTAGTSIEIALSRFCGPDDVITPISEEDEELRRSLGYRGPQNCRLPLRHHGVRDVLRLVRARGRASIFYNHIGAREVRSRIGAEIWNGYYTFCFDRNPWDRVVSLYYWRRRSTFRRSIAEFIEAGRPISLKRRGWDLYTIDGRPAVQRICRFEDLEAELETVRRRVGLPELIDLPRAKSGIRTDRRHYRDILGEKERMRVAEMFADEIELLGYEF